MTRAHVQEQEHGDTLEGVGQVEAPPIHAPTPDELMAFPERTYCCMGCGYAGDTFHAWAFHCCTGTPQLNRNIG